jgi:predicted  nucleic acid-binding Zn-ribbon protein
MLQSQIARKSKDFDELRMQFEYLRKQEEDSSKELEKLQTRANKEEQRLRSLLEDK